MGSSSRSRDVLPGIASVLDAGQQGAQHIEMIFFCITVLSAALTCQDVLYFTCHNTHPCALSLRTRRQDCDLPTFFHAW